MLQVRRGTHAHSHVVGTGTVFPRNANICIQAAEELGGVFEQTQVALFAPMSTREFGKKTAARRTHSALEVYDIADKSQLRVSSRTGSYGDCALPVLQSARSCVLEFFDAVKSICIRLGTIPLCPRV